MRPLNDVLAVILGGGRGTRLYPLTKMRSKPAVPIAGNYRLIDIPISNCINSGILRVHVLTQFNSVSLHRHIAETYKFDAFHTGWVQILAAEQTMESAAWYQGTADAVRKQLTEIRAAGAEHVLILAGDHLYRMDYAAMIAFHQAKGADITVAVQPVLRSEASRFGLLKRNGEGRIVDFVEKPKDPAAQDRMVSRDDPERPFLGSMGIYVFRTEVLLDLLTAHPDQDDFGTDVIPGALAGRPVYGYDFEGYWEDIGTIRSFYDTNLQLTKPNAPFNFYDTRAPIYTHSRFLPGSIVTESHLTDVLFTEGCVACRAEIRNAIIGLRSQIGEGARIVDSIVMGADVYEKVRAEVPMGIGPDCHIEGAILDKNVRLGRGVQIRPFPRGTELDAGHFVVQDGIVVIPKGTTLPAGTCIGPE
ncbi:MAG: Glucose-1-phosphate adenylyltransferase [Acidobacteria bacterium ADurb.Bin340]|nr:MAG: Glucose-1-phosphate adenylyltransferase [Acidobacteria bacterium ADurb.Bin340]